MIFREPPPALERTPGHEGTGARSRSPLRGGDPLRTGDRLRKGVRLRKSCHRRGSLGVLSSLVLALTCLPDVAQAEGLIKRPGAHNRYSFELEPHLVAYWGGWRGWNRGRFEGAQVGPGVRMAIPFMHNGPIDSINNNIGISFGIDTFFPNNDFLMSMPVAFQWNFYFTDIVSVLGEAGLVTNLYTGPGESFDLTPLFQGGGRFQFGKVGIVVRIGYPTGSVGANFQF